MQKICFLVHSPSPKIPQLIITDPDGKPTELKKSELNTKLDPMYPPLPPSGYMINQPGTENIPRTPPPRRRQAPPPAPVRYYSNSRTRQTISQTQQGRPSNSHGIRNPNNSPLQKSSPTRITSEARGQHVTSTQRRSTTQSPRSTSTNPSHTAYTYTPTYTPRQRYSSNSSRVYVPRSGSHYNNHPSNSYMTSVY